MEQKKALTFSADLVALWTTLFFIVISPFENIVRIEKIYYVVCVVILAICLFLKKIIKKDVSLNWILYLIYAGITCIWSINTSLLSDMFTLVVVVAFLYLQLQFDYSREAFEKIKNAFIIQGIILMILCVRFGSYMDNRFWLKTATSGADPNYLSGWFIIPICFIVERLFDRSIKLIWKGIMCIEIVSFFYFIMQSGSRAGLIANTAALIISMLFTVRITIKRHPVRAFVLLFVLAAVMIAGIHFMPDIMITRLLSSNISMSGRAQIWRQLFHVLKSHPLGIVFGMGQGSVAMYNSYNMVSHNTFYDIWFSLGIVGLTLILHYLFVGFKNCLKNRPYAAIALITMGILIFTLSALTTRFVMLCFFIIGARIQENDDNLSITEETES